MIAIYSHEGLTPYGFHVINVSSSDEDTFFKELVREGYIIPPVGTEVAFVENNKVIAHYHLSSEVNNLE